MSSAAYYPTRGTPTVYPAENFNAVEDAATLRKAMKGFGADQKTVIDILARRGVVQRMEIAEAFKTTYGKDLNSHLKSEFHGNLETVLLALVTPLPQFYAKELHNAVANIGTDNECVIEILSTLSNHGIKTVAQLYEQLYGKSLEADLKSDTSGHFKRWCVASVQGHRDENQEIDKEAAIADATALYNSGEAIKWGTDESTFISILINRSYKQLSQIFKEYETIAGHDIEKAIKGEFSGPVQTGFLAIVKCCKSKVDYFAERLYKSMARIGTNDKTLIRIIVSRSEIDLGDIKEAFQRKYEKTLETWIKDDTSGDYKEVLTILVGGK